MLAIFQQIGVPEMIVIGIIALLIFGRRLPEVGRSLGKSFVEFKKGLRDTGDDVKQVRQDMRSAGEDVRQIRNDARQATPDSRVTDSHGLSPHREPSGDPIRSASERPD
ncbi:MAG TPA: twin-arginine translocase TatA/TatE family subunit [Phycisphaerae bacterium]|nr:twin-arginine translocase TatA/TatE family subunit [Phycisphaerae bacterium]